MKTTILVFIATTVLTTTLKAEEQRSIPQAVIAEKKIILNDTIISSREADTTIVRIGRKTISIIKDENESHKKVKSRKFDGH
jgi:hypothetical protein